MLMATLTRRLQVLLNEQRFAQLEHIARQRRTTIAALVRDALERTYPSDALPSDVAAERFLAREPMELGSWDQAKREIEDSLERGRT
jgi:predicted DNA-binding ribbon-helix-helix protein